MRLAKECQKCNKFSHCNNNDLFCQKFIMQELQTAKEENEKLTKNASGYLYQKRVNKCIDLEVQIKQLTQQNKQLKEELSWLETFLRDFFIMIKKTK